MQGAMYCIEQEGVATPMGELVTELFVYVDEHGFNLYYVEDDYLVQEPYVFADEGHLEALKHATFKGLLTYEVNRSDGHPILTVEQRRSFNDLNNFDDAIDKGNTLLLAFDDVVNFYMGSAEDAKRQALDWLDEQYDPEHIAKLRPID